MSSETKFTTELAGKLEQHSKEISTSWLQFVQQQHNPPHTLSLQELESAATRGLKAIIGYLTNGSDSDLEAYLEEILREQERWGCGCGQIVSNLLLYKDAILPVLVRSYVSEPSSLQHVISIIDTCLRDLVGHFSEKYTHESNRHLEKQQQHTATLLEMVRTASSSLMINDVLRQVAKSISTSVGTGHCGFFLIDEKRRTIEPKFELTVPEFVQLASKRNVPVPMPPMLWDTPGFEFNLWIIETRKPLVCTDVQTGSSSEEGLCQRLGIRSILAIPFLVKGRMVAIAWAFTYDEPAEFSQAQIDLACGLADSAALAIENAQLYDETHKLLDESQSLQQVTTALLQERELEQVLDIVCAGALKLTGASGSAVFLLKGDQWLWISHHSGDCPPMQKIPMEGTLNGEAVRTGKPILSNEADTHPALLRDTSLDRPSRLLAVPLIAKGKAIGVLDLVDKPGGFTDEDVRITKVFADQVALAIENARLNQQVEQLVVIQERNRLSREIHDDLAPTLGTMQLRASLLADHIDHGRVEMAHHQVVELQDLISEAYVSVREDVFNLRAVAAINGNFIVSLQEYLTDYQRSYGVTVQFECYGETEAKLGGKVQIQAIRIIQEALNNVRKHAGVNRAQVAIERTEDQITISISDNGCGFDPALVSARSQSSFGLQVMRERAESVGCNLRIESAPRQGTKIIFQVPLATNRLSL